MVFQKECPKIHPNSIELPHRRLEVLGPQLKGNKKRALMHLLRGRELLVAMVEDSVFSNKGGNASVYFVCLLVGVSSTFDDQFRFVRNVEAHHSVLTAAQRRPRSYTGSGPHQ